MYSENDLKELSDDYQAVKAPYQVYINANKILHIKKEEKEEEDNKKQFNLKKFLIYASSFAVLFTIIININLTFASTLSKIPILGTAFQLITFREHEESGDKYEIKIDNVKLEGTDNSNLSIHLNEKYNERVKQLDEEFQLRASELDRKNVSLTAEYGLKAHNDNTMSIELIITEVAASSMTRLEYDTIDIKNETIITLPSLFKNNTYVDVISEEIKNQMEHQILINPYVNYFIEEDSSKTFQKIDQNQQFYISNDNKLVIVFDKYEVAPGYMGALEFEIPTEVISNILEESNYIK